MNRILIIADGESDLLHLMSSQLNATVIPTDSDGFDTEEYDALAILGGNADASLIIPAPMHVCLDKMRAQGKPVFCEFMGSFGAVRGRGTVSTERQRMVYYANGISCEGLKNGDLLDGHANDCIKYAPIATAAQPVLTYQEDACAHSNLKIDAEKHKEGLWALWWLDGSTLISSVRLCNFHRARFSPPKRWQALISFIASFLAGEAVTLEFEPPVCTYEDASVKSASDVDAAVRRGIAWITEAGMLKKGGVGGAHEGFNNRISAKNGVHTMNRNIRTDCTCELGGALLFDSLLTGNKCSGAAARALLDFAFKNLQVKEGEHRGMLRWSEVAWETCFQDDAARAIIPGLLCQHFDVEIPHFEEIKEALDYMVKTTGEDGIRTACTEICNFDETTWDKLREAGSGGAPCAHFNAYYHAALLLAYRACGDESYLKTALRGLSSLMAVYPDTRRETSETEESCRLIFPLAVLYGVTGESEHYGWLAKVVDALQACRHPSGGYAEWDSGYKAFCSRNHKGECALLADNGDPVADLLYSNNWLPLGFSYAYMVTGEERFRELWRSSAEFMLRTQMHSEDKHLDGAWARAFDMEAGDNYGMPHDAGWGPYCIESGWTVGEILMGLQFMHVAEKKVEK